MPLHFYINIYNQSTFKTSKKFFYNFQIFHHITPKQHICICCSLVSACPNDMCHCSIKMAKCNTKHNTTWLL